MDTKTPTFWMIPRELLNLAQNGWYYQKALINYNILFTGPQLISDSDFLNNIHLRNAILNEPYAKQLVESDFLQFAIRTQSGERTLLKNTANKIFENNGQPKTFDREAFTSGLELDWIENNGKIRNYSFLGASERYTREVTKVFQQLSIINHNQLGIHQLGIPLDLVKIIRDILEERMENNETIQWSYFLEGSPIWGKVRGLSNNIEIKDSYLEYIYSITRGPYVTFIPDSLGLNPAFSKEDSLGIDIWRGRFYGAKEELEKKTTRRPRVSLVDFTQGLSAFTIDDIIRLRESDERKGLDNEYERFNRNLSDSSALLKALLEYRNRIDRKILQNTKSNIEDIEEQVEISKVKSFINNMKGYKEKEPGEWLYFGIKYAADFFTFGLPSVLEFVYTRLQKRKDELNSNNIEIEKELLISEMRNEARNSDKPRILDSKIISDKPGVLDFCSSQTNVKNS